MTCTSLALLKVLNWFHFCINLDVTWMLISTTFHYDPTFWWDKKLTVTGRCSPGPNLPLLGSKVTSHVEACDPLGCLKNENNMRIGYKCMDRNFVSKHSECFEKCFDTKDSINNQIIVNFLIKVLQKGLILTCTSNIQPGDNNQHLGEHISSYLIKGNGQKPAAIAKGG